MIIQIIKCYFVILLSLSIVSILIFGVGLRWILIRNSTDSSSPLSPDLMAIAGEDVIATQLDLARAYMETNQVALAKSMLQVVMAEGNSSQRKEAQRLLSSTI
jgi:FimV-like protein